MNNDEYMNQVIEFRDEMCLLKESISSQLGMIATIGKKIFRIIKTLKEHLDGFHQGTNPLFRDDSFPNEFSFVDYTRNQIAYLDGVLQGLEDNEDFEDFLPEADKFSIKGTPLEVPDTMCFNGVVYARIIDFIGDIEDLPYQSEIENELHDLMLKWEQIKEKVEEDVE